MRRRVLCCHTTPWAKKCDVDYANGYQCSDCRECLVGSLEKYISQDKGGRGDVCEADDLKRGPCYAKTAPWEEKCKTDYVFGCEGCSECEFPAAISKTSGKKDVFDSRCDKGPVCKNFDRNPAKCNIGYHKKFLCNACAECQDP